MPLESPISAILLAYVSGALDFSRALNPDAADAHFCALAGAILGCLLSQFVNQCDGVLYLVSIVVVIKGICCAVDISP